MSSKKNRRLSGETEETVVTEAKTAQPRTLEKSNTAQSIVPLLLFTVLFFLTLCWGSSSTVKVMALVQVASSLIAGGLCWKKLSVRVSIPFFCLTLITVMDGISTLYAKSGKFALYEFLKVLIAYCVVLILLSCAPRKNMEPGRWIATVLSGGMALVGITSIDLFSTQWISTPILSLLSTFSSDYTNLVGVEGGVRMYSIFINPNIFAGSAGLAVILSLGLATSSAGTAERRIHLSLLFINALAFLLAFSMGASGMIAIAFVVWLFLEQREKRAGLLLLMMETFGITIVSAMFISQTSFSEWNGIQPVPLLCLIIGCIVLCLLDQFVGQKAANKIPVKVVPIATISIIAAMGILAVVLYHFTGDTVVQQGEVLRRAAYPDPGSYTLSIEADADINVTIESQNQSETMMHTSTVLYQGTAANAVFTVPEASLVTYFNFYAPQTVNLRSASCASAENSAKAVSIPLGYKLLPSFMANRLQGLFANENAIQRFVFFSDGLKLFQRSPIIGRGMGAFENGIKSVQSFYYETKYAHNHYIQVLAETGVIGFLLFVGTLVTSGLAIWFARKKENVHPLLPALGAALVFMAGHAAVEVVFSSYAYLPIAFCIVALIGLCCGEALPIPELKQKVRLGVIGASGVLMILFSVLVVRNIMAQRLLQRNPSFDSVARAVQLDQFEWADYMLSYVTSSLQVPGEETVQQQAAEYAARLAQLDSNTIPIYLAQYYFYNGQTDEAFQMIQKYVDYVSSDESAWRDAFSMMMSYEQPTEEYRRQVAAVSQMLDAWNQKNMSNITLEEDTQAFRERCVAES